MSGIRPQSGQSLAESVLIIASVALIAVLGFSAVNSGVGSQSASMAEALAGGAPRTLPVIGAATNSSGHALPDFDSAVPAAEGASEPAGRIGSVAFVQGIGSGLIDNLWAELSVLLNPIDAAIALAELGRLLATQPAATVALLFDELVAKQLDTLINGNDYERGFVIGGQVSPAKALSVLAKVSGAGVLAGIARKLEDSDEVARVNGRRPINSAEYAGKVHPSGVYFNKKGFPDFSPHAKAEVEIDGLTGRYKSDAAKANSSVGLDETPDGYVWHHVEDGRTMQLVPRDIHNAARHTGGAAVIRGNRSLGGKT